MERGGFPFTFTGEMVDANDLVYLRARYYHPGLGVFTGLDPVEGDATRAMSLNRYGYVAGNVVNMVDPSGMSYESPSIGDNCFSQKQAGGVCDFTIDSEWNIVLKYPNSNVASQCTAAAMNLFRANANTDHFYHLAFDHDEYCRPNIHTLASPIENTPSAHRFCLAYLDGLHQHDPERWHQTIGHDKPQFLEVDLPSQYLTLGYRIDASVGPAYRGLDINFEQHCTLTSGGILGVKPKCGWFANVSLVGSTSILSGNATIGFVLGHISFPEEPGTTIFSYQLGGNASVGGFTLELDGTANLDGEWIGFIGIGIGGDLLPVSIGGYGAIGASVYMGPQLFLPMTPQKSWQRLIEVVEFLRNV